MRVDVMPALLGASLTLAVFALAAMPPQLAQRMDHLSAATQDMLRAHDTAWVALTPSQQDIVRRRMAAWDALPEAVRRDRREHWQAWRALPADQRLQVQAAAIALAALPPQQQLAWHAAFAQADAGERHGWLLGPALGADFVALQPLLMQVPADLRGPLLRTLRDMTPAERADLAVLAQRTPPQKREALQRALVATSATNRAGWLQSRLAQ